jgi:hypothetical protein
VKKKIIPEKGLLLKIFSSCPVEVYLIRVIFGMDPDLDPWIGTLDFGSG